MYWFVALPKIKGFLQKCYRDEHGGGSLQSDREQVGNKSEMFSQSEGQELDNIINESVGFITTYFERIIAQVSGTLGMLGDKRLEAKDAADVFQGMAMLCRQIDDILSGLDVSHAKLQESVVATADGDSGSEDTMALTQKFSGLWEVILLKTDMLYEVVNKHLEVLVGKVVQESTSLQDLKQRRLKNSSGKPKTVPGRESAKYLYQG